MQQNLMLHRPTPALFTSHASNIYAPNLTQLVFGVFVADRYILQEKCWKKWTESCPLRTRPWTPQFTAL